MIVARALAEIGDASSAEAVIRLPDIVDSSEKFLSSIFRSIMSSTMTSIERAILACGIVSIFSDMLDIFVATDLGLDDMNEISRKWKNKRVALLRNYFPCEEQAILEEADRFRESLSVARLRSTGASDLYQDLKAFCVALIVQFPRRNRGASEFEDSLFALNQLISKLAAVAF